MRVLWLTLALLLAGCALPHGVPAWLVMLTPGYPTTDGRCTGAALDPYHVLTAAHCVRAVRRVITPAGQEAWIVAARVHATQDVALLTLDRPLITGSYATLAAPQADMVTTVWGVCPYYWGHQARTATYAGRETVSEQRGRPGEYDTWWTLPMDGDTNKVCGGDSGGVVVQQGAVVGLISAVEAEYFWVAIGEHFYTVPPDDIDAWLE